MYWKPARTAFHQTFECRRSRSWAKGPVRRGAVLSLSASPFSTTWSLGHSQRNGRRTPTHNGVRTESPAETLLAKQPLAPASKSAHSKRLYSAFQNKLIFFRTSVNMSDS
jgi:hypothetical protein